MKSIALIVIFYFFYLTSSGQCYFYNLYDHDQKDNFGSALIEDIEGNYILAGRAHINPFGDATFTVKLDMCGNLLWKRAHELSPGAGAETVSKILDRGEIKVLIGSHKDWTKGKASAYLLNLSNQGDSLYFKNIVVGPNDVTVDAIQIGDTSFILAGYYNEPLPDGKLFLVKTDTLGNILWQIDYGDSVSYHYLKSLDKTADGGFILGGRQNWPSGYRELMLLKTDSVGNQLWKKLYGGFHQGHVITTSDGGFLLGGNKQLPALNYAGYLVKTDSAGNIQWQRTFDKYLEPGVFMSMKEKANGNFIIAGTGSGYKWRPNNYLAEISRDGDTLLWERIYTYFGGDHDDDYVEDLIITKDGDIALTGYVIPAGIPNSNGNDLFILKVDSCGFLNNDTTLSAAFHFSRLIKTPTTSPIKVLTIARFTGILEMETR